MDQTMEELVNDKMSVEEIDRIELDTWNAYFEHWSLDTDEKKGLYLEKCLAAMDKDLKSKAGNMVANSETTELERKLAGGGMEHETVLMLCTYCHLYKSKFNKEFMVVV